MIKPPYSPFTKGGGKWFPFNEDVNHFFLPFDKGEVEGILLAINAATEH
jgi:hypothetical protein